MSNDLNRDELKGGVAGFLGGLAGTWAMTEYQAFWSRVVHGYESPSAAGRHDAREWQERSEGGDNANELAADAVARATLDRPLGRNEMQVAAPLMHYAFGAGVSAAYGVFAERAAWATAGTGAGFGTFVWAAADEAAVPMLGLSHPGRHPADAHLQAFTAHLVFGITTELVRKAVRRALR
jgi:putative membrane protein